MLIIKFQTKILALHSLTFEPHEIQQFVSPLNTLWRGYLIVHTKFGDSILAELMISLCYFVTNTFITWEGGSVFMTIVYPSLPTLGFYFMFILC